MEPKSSPEQAVAQPYSVFSTPMKRYIVFTASGAGLFSSLSAQIYFPALNTLAKEMNVTSTLINLTVTSYMVSSLPQRGSNKTLTNCRSSKEFRPCSLVTLQTKPAADPPT